MLKLKRVLVWLFLFIAVFFIIPSAVAVGVHLAGDGPRSWRDADWSSSGLLARFPDQAGEAVIHLMAARTGGLKGALSVHTWLLVKAKGEEHYRRYDVVGWGRPVRQDAYAPDARWYSNDPRFIGSVRGKEAEALIPSVEAAVASYPYANPGDYRIWPGPNSNSFIAHILNEVPQLGFVTPALGVGRSYLGETTFVRVDPDWLDIQISLGGYVGFAIGRRHGLEFHFLGLTAGVDLSRPAIKLPGFGRIGMS